MRPSLDNKLCDHICRNTMGAMERPLLQHSEGFLEEVLPELVIKDKLGNQVKKGDQDLADTLTELMASCANYFPNTGDFALK